MKVKKKKYLLIHSVTFIELGRIHTKFHEDRSNLLIVTALQPDRQMLKAQIQTGCCLTRSFIILSFKTQTLLKTLATTLLLCLQVIVHLMARFLHNLLIFQTSYFQLTLLYILFLFLLSME